MKNNKATTNWMGVFNLAWVNCYRGPIRVGSWKPVRIIGDE